jgi:hypothetical protein
VIKFLHTATKTLHIAIKTLHTVTKTLHIAIKTSVKGYTQTEKTERMAENAEVAQVRRRK